MSWTGQITDIAIGNEVFGSDGGKVGNVAEVHPSYIVVEKGFFFPTDYYIPASAVSSYNDGQIYLNVAKDAALHSGWDTVPTDLDVMVPTGMDTAAMETSVTTAAATNEEIRIPVMEEELTATVRPTQAGAVRIEKDVVTEERTLEVPVTEERVRVERRVVDRPATAADAEQLADVVIEVPLRGETVDVQKEARVAEEIVISKEAVQRTEQVSDTVRREEVFIDEDAAIDPNLIEGTGRGASRTP